MSHEWNSLFIRANIKKGFHFRESNIIHFFCLIGYDSMHIVKRLPTFGRNNVLPPPTFALCVPSRFLKNRRPNKIIKPERKPQITKSLFLVVSLQFTTLCLRSHVAASTRLLPTVQLWLSLQVAHFSLQHIPFFRQIV